MDEYSTHQTPLIAAIMCSSNRPAIAEFGCGNYSTPIINSIARSVGTRAVTYAKDTQWMSRFTDLTSDWHRFEAVEHWPTFRILEGMHFDVLLLDNEEYCRDRANHLTWLQDFATTVVSHDFNIVRQTANLDHWKYVLEYKRYKPTTGILTNSKDVFEKVRFTLPEMTVVKS